MNIVYGSQIQIFLVPTKKSLPASDITVGFSDTLNLLCQGVLQDGVEVVHVPRTCGGVHETSGEIGPIDGRRVGDGLPELSCSSCTKRSF